MLDGTTPPDVVHHGSLRRSVAALVVVGVTGSAAGVLLAAGVLTAQSGHAPDIHYMIIYVAGYTLMFTLFSAIAECRRPAEVRFTAEGIELTAARRDGVFIPWQMVSKIQMRRLWPLAMLDV